MISRAHGLALSVLLGAAAATGAYALIATAHLGDAQTKPEVVSSRQIAQRAQKLDAWETSLQKTLKARPPALPPLNRYAAVTFVAAPGAATLPAPAPVTLPVAQQTKPSPKPSPKPITKPAAKPAARHPKKRIDAVATPSRDDDAPRNAAPVAAPVRSATDPAPSPAVVVAAAPTPAPVAAAPSSPPAALSVEQQCRSLLRAAENKSEQVKQEAERQCEALKNAAEKKG